MTILQKICCYFLLAKLFLYLCPDEKYEDYFSLLLEWTMLLMLVFSVMGSGHASDALERGRMLWEEMQEAANKSRQEAAEEVLADFIEKSFDEDEIERMQQELYENTGTDSQKPSEQNEAEREDAKQEDAGQEEAEREDAEREEAKQEEAEREDAEREEAKQEEAKQEEAERTDAEQEDTTNR